MITVEFLSELKRQIRVSRQEAGVESTRLTNELFNNPEYNAVITGLHSFDKVESALAGDSGRKIAVQLSKVISQSAIDYVSSGSVAGTNVSLSILRELGGSESQFRLFDELNSFGIHDTISRIQINRRFPFKPDKGSRHTSVYSEKAGFTEPKVEPVSYGVGSFKTYDASPTLRERSRRIADIAVDAVRERIRIANYLNSRGEGLQLPEVNKLQSSGYLKTAVEDAETKVASVLIRYRKSDPDMVAAFIKDARLLGKVSVIEVPTSSELALSTVKERESGGISKVLDLKPLPTLWEYINKGGFSRSRYIEAHEFVKEFNRENRKLRKAEELLANKLKEEAGRKTPSTLVLAHAQDVAPKMFEKWFSRLITSEYQRAVQWAALRTYKVFSIRFVKWQLATDHYNRLSEHNLVRDWCDDLAQCPPEISIPKDAAYIRDLAATDPEVLHGINRKTKYWDGNEWSMADTPAYLGIYYSKNLYKVTIPAYQWFVKKKTQFVYGRQIRDIFIPPHPYCSCIMLPIYINPEDSDRWERVNGTRLKYGGKSIIQVAVESVGVAEVRNMLMRMEEESVAHDLSYADIILIMTPSLSGTFSPDEITRIARIVADEGPEELYSPADEITRIAA